MSLNQLRKKAVLSAQFGVGGAFIEPGAGDPSAHEVLAGIIYSLQILSGATSTPAAAEPAALAAVTVGGALSAPAATTVGGALSAPSAETAGSIATADGNDAGTTQTLANATKAAFNLLQTDVGTLVTEVGGNVTQLNLLRTDVLALRAELAANVTLVNQLLTDLTDHRTKLAAVITYVREVFTNQTAAGALDLPVGSEYVNANLAALNAIWDV